jgi:hypothetical protein
VGSIATKVLLVATFLIASGCAVSQTTVGHLAAHDLECPAEQIEVVRDMPFEKTLRGCGREVTYVRSSGGSSPMGVPRSADAWNVRVAAD